MALGVDRAVWLGLWHLLGSFAIGNSLGVSGLEAPMLLEVFPEGWEITVASKHKQIRP